MDDLTTTLFDLSFKKFLMPKIAKPLYILGVVTSVVTGLSMMRGGGLAMLLGPAVAILGIIMSRIVIEVALAVLQIARYSAEVARRGRPANQDGDESDS